MKQCSKCKEWKDGGEFYKDKRAKDGLHSSCKTCHIKTTRRYHDSERGQRIIKMYLKSEKGQVERKEATRRYRNSEKAKEAERRKRLTPDFPVRNERHQRKYNQSEKGKSARIAYRQRNQQKVMARRAIQIEVKARRIPPAKELPCHYCSSQAHEYHHYKGYDQEYWFDVVPVCRKCHKLIHNNQLHTEQYNQDRPIQGHDELRSTGPAHSSS